MNIHYIKIMHLIQARTLEIILIALLVHYTEIHTSWSYTISLLTRMVTIGVKYMSTTQFRIPLNMLGSMQLTVVHVNNTLQLIPNLIVLTSI